MQEIWDEIQTLKSTVGDYGSTIAILQAQEQALHDQALFLHYASGGSLGWHVTTVDSSGGDVGHYTSLAFGSDGEPAISYYDSGNADLKYARLAGGSRILTTIDSEGSVGIFSSLAFAQDGLPAIAYGGPGVLKYAHMEVFSPEP